MGTEVVGTEQQPVSGNQVWPEDTSTSCEETTTQKQLVNGDSNKLNEAVSGCAELSCNHIKKCVEFNTIKKALKTTGLESKVCYECQRSNTTQTTVIPPTQLESSDALSPLDEEASALWLCLKCGVQLCRQNANKDSHYLEHFQKPRSDPHCLFVNTTTFSVWCFVCKQSVDTKRKKLLECIEYLKKDAEKVTMTLKQQSASVKFEVNKKGATAIAIQPLKLKTEDSNVQNNNNTNNNIMIFSETKLNNCLSALPRVRGLSNLGNTCFFNALLQCLAQTPFLSSVLKESSQPGEYIQLPGGKLKLNDDDEEEIELPPISGNLPAWYSLTSAVSDTIDELKSGNGGVHNPRNMLSQFTSKWPQFGDGDQHDSHELLRHLLESVRNEDLRRYHSVILQTLGYSKKIDPQTVQEDVRKKIKFYGNQAADRILRPEQVFRGFLVSTLTCQDCYHTSSRHESFLDISLPVSADKPQPPIRRRNSPEPDDGQMIALPMKSSSSEMQPVSKYQLKKERKKERKTKRTQRKQKMDKNGNNSEEAAGGGDSDEVPKGSSDGARTLSMGDNDDKREDAANNEDEDDENESSNESKSDADIEDNCVEDEAQGGSGLNNRMLNLNIKGDEAAGAHRSPPSGEKRDDTPENPNKSDFEAKNVVLEVGMSESAANNFVQQYELKEDPAEMEAKTTAKREKATTTARQRTVSHSDWSTTIAPRYQCEDGECSVQSCLNNFTGIELMTGNNKVGCDACTERVNGKDGKSVRTNATKQFLISSPPAVLILHLKRFQVGPRCMFRKLSKHVTFPFVLDIAPFCGTKIKNLPNVDRGQKKLLYSLYGIVEHSGGMHGGHYTAFVKVRPDMSKDDKRWKFIPQGSKAELDQTDEQRILIEEAMAKAREKMENDSDDSISQSSSASSACDYNEEDGAVGGSFPAHRESRDDEADKITPPPGRWFYVSDSSVREMPEDAVLKAQAYLLFYERIY